MIKIFKNQKIIFLFFIVLIFIVSFLAFWKAFNFDFWGEDWEQIWFAAFDPSKINNIHEMQHPIVIFEELFLVKIFAFNTFYWQMIGFMLKVLSVLAVSLMMWGITKSKKVAFFTGLIYASAVGGVSSFTWVAAHASALIIPFLALGVYFWVIKGKFLLAFIFLIFSLWADPSRGIFGSLLVILWEILSIFQHRQNLSESKKKILILLITVIVTSFIFHKIFDYSDTVFIGYNLSIVFKHPLSSLNNFLTNLGNLLAGWIIPIPQNIFSVSSDNLFGKVAGYFFVIQGIIFLIHFLKKKDERSKVILFFSAWIPLFFFPNWLLPNQEMIQNGQVLGMTHRYLTLSAIGLVCLLGYGISVVKGNLFKAFLLVLVVGSNIIVSNQILQNESYYHSVIITKPIWDKIDKDVPASEENSIFFIQGESKFIVNSISQAKIPFAIRRGIKEKDKWPASTSDPGVVKRYLCGNNEDKRIIPLSHLHAWYIKDNTLDNISEKVRREFSEVDCSFQ